MKYNYYWEMNENENWSQVVFKGTCQYCFDMGINEISEIAQVLVATHGFKMFEVEGSFSITGEHPDEDEYYNSLKEMGFID